MSPEPRPAGPDPEAAVNLVREIPAADVVTMGGAEFLPLDDKKRFPDLATIVWIHEFGVDRVSDPADDRLAPARARQRFRVAG